MPNALWMELNEWVYRNDSKPVLILCWWPLQMAHLSWWYYMSKFVEFCDTIFFVLRKKLSHISTLHVIHHGIMPISVWWGVKFTPGGHSTFFAFVNSAVHIIMYIYYGLSAMGPHMNRYLWWKKYMTTIQMVWNIRLLFIIAFVCCVIAMSLFLTPKWQNSYSTDESLLSEWLAKNYRVNPLNMFNQLCVCLCVCV